MGRKWACGSIELELPGLEYLRPTQGGCKMDLLGFTKESNREGSKMSEEGETFGQNESEKWHTCECAKWEVQDGEEATNTGCNRETKSVFAQGHDAKLKSFLIWAGALGLELGYDASANGIWTVGLSAEEAADKYNFGYQVREGIRNAQAKATKKARAKALKAEKAQNKAEKQAAKSLAKVTKAIKTRKTQGPKKNAIVKIGRWEYTVLGMEGVDDNGKIQVRYIAKDGTEKTASVDPAKVTG